MLDATVPIRRWRVRNFKSIEQADLPLTALTVLVGPNSGGKSSVLQSILLASQAAQARGLGPTIPLNGGLVELGAYSELKSAFAADQDPISVGAVFDLATPWTDSRLENRHGQQALFEPEESDEPRFADWAVDLTGEAPLEPGAAAIGSVTIELRQRESLQGKRAAFRLETKARAVPNDDLHRPDRVVPPPRMFRNVYSPRETFGEYSTFWTGSVVRGGEQSDEVEGVTLLAGFPSQYLTRSDENREVARLWIERAQQFPSRDENRTRSGSEPAFESIVAKAAEEIADWLKSTPEAGLLTYYQHVRRTLPGRGLGVPASLLRQIAFDPAFTEEVVRRIGPGRGVLATNPVPSEAYEQPLEILASSVSYLGPLRQEPEIVYRRTAPGRPRYLGSRGEFTAPVLHSLRNSRVDVPLPRSEQGATETVSLAAAMNEWLAFLEAASTIETRDRGRLGFELTVTQPNLPRGVDLTSVGVGVSQVVPVVLLCLLSRPGSVLLLEQPELHLHPAMQQRLGDFFLALARTGRQLLVETHSEYLVTRLRRRIAEDPGQQTSSAVSIFNVCKQDGRTKCTSVPVNSFGSIEDWPTGFFDQATTDAEQLLWAALHKQREQGQA